MNPLIAATLERTRFYLRLLSDKNPHVRKKAAVSLGKIGNVTSLAKLKAQLKQETNADVQKAIRTAIEAIEDG